MAKLDNDFEICKYFYKIQKKDARAGVQTQLNL